MKMDAIKSDLIGSINTNNNVVDIAVGANLIAVETINLGLASVLKEQQHPEKVIEEAGNLNSLPVKKLVQFLESTILLKASIGMAVVNSLLPVPQKYDNGNAFGLIQSKSKGKNLGIIGHFHFVNRLKSTTKNCWVFEKEPQGEDLHESKIYEFLPQCDVVAITGQTIINNTLGQIIELSQKAYKIILGPSAPLSPVLFDYGIDAIGGVRINQNDAIKRYIIQGANFRQLPGVDRLIIHK
jgi:uncharacterized protein (DUF4213/DUF364 family)